MKNKPKYLVSIYLENSDILFDTPQYYSICVADIEKDMIIESATRLYEKQTFEQDLSDIVEEIYPECLILFSNENLKLTKYLIDNYKKKLVLNETILKTRIVGWTPSKNIIDSFYLRKEQHDIFIETYGVINLYLDKGHGRI